MIALRLVVNTGARMMFTFLPEFSRGTGLGIDQLGRLLAARDLSALVAPAAGRASDRRGTRRIMLVGGVATGAGALLMTLGATGMVFGLLLFGLGRIGYHVAMNAWVGHEVAYEQRGRATGQVEMTWAGAALVGIPTMGLLIDRLGWRAAPAAIGLLGLPLTLVLARRLPAHRGDGNGAAGRPFLTRSAWLTLGAFTLLNGAAQFLVFTHGIWLEDAYGLDPSRIGLFIVAVGAAELTASFGSSRLTDRLGKRNSVAAGAAVLTAGLAGLALVDRPPLAVGLILLVVAFLGFEYAIVSAIPLIAELDPNARAEVIGRSVGLSILSRSGGSLVAAIVIVEQGFRATMVIATALAALTAAVTVLGVREPTGDQPSAANEAGSGTSTPGP